MHLGELRVVEVEGLCPSFILRYILEIEDGRRQANIDDLSRRHKLSYEIKNIEIVFKAKMPFTECAMSLVVLGMLIFSTVSSYRIVREPRIGVIAGDFPVFGIGDGGGFMKRAVPVVGDMSEMPSDMKDAIHGVKMGVSSDICDNAKNNLAIDWDGSPLNYTCYHPKNRLPIIEVRLYSYK
ncbi:hypothetical protein AVEN_91803-1 [Araneus ventricosus]|uniref:Uncharacterized protein n=1 Tax=Araneus ventricosus TaxID=182803 RepID=A0A4Y2K5B0_ARAVE|nr:hypothetical protein AVEN_91803-1 [Araneus ventricosus]